MESRRSKPLVPLTAIWDKDSKSRYPETLRIPMDDGTVVNYEIVRERQPHPCFLAALENIKSLPKGSYPQKNAPDSDG